MAEAACEIKKETSSESICRLCFTEREDFRLIFVDEYSSLHQWIGNLTSLKIVKVPGAPASLCLECENTLKNFESFREMCFTNDRVFKEMFTQDQDDTRNDTILNTMTDVSRVSFGQSDNQETDILGYTVEDPDAKITVGTTLNSEENYHDAEESQKFESHQKRVHEDGDDKTQCTICNKFVKRIKKHMHLHTKIPHVCSWCDKSFIRPNELKIHIRRHTQERPFKCDACGKSFSIYSNLVRHGRTPTGCKPFSCDVCEAKFTQSSELELHMELHSLENKESPTNFAEDDELNFDM